MAKAEKEKFDVRKMLVENFVNLLEKGTAPWVQPWRSKGGSSRPINAVSGKKYRGANVLLLWAWQLEHSYPLSRWISWNAAVAAGGTIKEGEAKIHCPVVYYSKFEKRDPTTGQPIIGKDGKPETGMSMRYYRVYNVAQWDGLPEKMTSGPVLGDGSKIRHEEADTMIAEYLQRSGIRLTEGGDLACYRPSSDSISMPARGLFLDQDEDLEKLRTAVARFYGVAFHECGHSTGHSTRLNRNLKNSFGSSAYAFEELVAELTSAFVMSDLGMGGICMHAEYLASWCQAIKDDPKALFTASRLATQAADYIQGEQALKEAEESEASEPDVEAAPVTVALAA